MTNYVGGGLLLHRRNMMFVADDGGGLFKNPIYNGTSADSNTIGAVFNVGYRSENTGSTNRTGMQATCWNNLGRCWTSTVKFNAKDFSTISAVFQRTAGNVTKNSYAVIVVSEKVEDYVVAKASYNIANMADAYGDYRYGRVDTNENGTFTASIDISDWDFKNGFYVSILYKNGVDGYYTVLKTNSISLS